MTFSRHIPACLIAGLVLALTLAGCATPEGLLTPPPATPTPSASPSPAPVVVTPSPSPVPTPSVEPYDYSRPAPENREADDAWFSDAVFVGDSRTDGLRLYGGIKQSNFICYKGLTSEEFDTKKCIKLGEETVTALEALERGSYAKVYLMLGLNELGYAVPTFSQEYSEVIDMVRAAQPNAVLYFQSVVPLNPQRVEESKLPTYFNNEKVAAFNAEIFRLCEEKQVVYLNVAEGLTDENGILPYERTHDGVHFSRDWYKQWYAYLKTHTVDPDTLEVPTHEETPDAPAYSVPVPGTDAVQLGLRK